MTPNEIEDMRLLQDLADSCPGLEHELFYKNSLGKRFLDLKQKHLTEMMEAMGPAMETISSALAKTICDKIDADIIRDMGKLIGVTL